MDKNIEKVIIPKMLENLFSIDDLDHLDFFNMIYQLKLRESQGYQVKKYRDKLNLKLNDFLKDHYN